jgi:hypothetical protein
VTEIDDKPFLDRLKSHLNRNHRRYILVLKDGLPMFERHPLCKAYDEILDELFGPAPDPE